MPLAAVEEAALWLGTRQVHYRVQRSVRRTYSLRVDARGVRVGVPARARRCDIEAFVREHGSWLLSRLQDVEAQQARTLFPVQDGALLPYRGGTLRLRVGTGHVAADHAHAHTHTRVRPRWPEGGPEGEEVLCLAPGPALAEVLIKILRQRALTLLTARVAVYCAVLGQPAPPVRLTAASTRWGSCSRRSGIRLHWRLIHLPDAVSDYVVAHEVAHLLEMNHSPRFWQVVERLYPDWRAARNALRRLGPELPVIVATDHAVPTNA